MDTVQKFDELLAALSRYQALGTLYSMRLRNENFRSATYSERQEWHRMASDRAMEFLKGLGAIKNKQLAGVSANDLPVLKPVYEFIDRQLMKKPENNIECVFSLLVIRYCWRSPSEQTYSIMSMARFCYLADVSLLFRYEPIITNSETLMARSKQYYYYVLRRQEEEEELRVQKGLKSRDGSSSDDSDGLIHVSEANIRTMDINKLVHDVAYV